MSGLHAARIDRSARLGRIIEVLKPAKHPLSAEEIAVRAYDFSVSKKIMLNVSTAVGEARAEVNRNAGYVVSEARAWKSARYPWHDGRPRYWLIAAPGWVPAWKITDDGELEAHGQKREEAAAAGVTTEDTGRVCKNPKCGKPLSPETDPLEWFCCEECRLSWRKGAFPQHNQAGPQGTLF